MTTDEILTKLNNYEQAHQDHGDPLNIWEDVIYWLDGYDEEATFVLDPNGESDQFALEDGRVFTFSINAGEWRQSND